MTKVLIAESEHADYQRLLGLIEWDRLGDYKVEYCDSGISALEKILSDCPDIVFTDIQLSGMDGIELIRRCREHGIASTFVVTSRWHRFEYAQSVMRLGVEEYLVKPVDKADLHRVMEAFVQRKSAQEARDMTESMLKTRRLLRNSFMEAFTSNEPPESYSIEKLNKKYHFNLHEGVFRTAIISVTGLPENEQDIFLPALAQSMRARFDPLCYEMIPYIRENARLTLTFNYAPGSDAEKHFTDILDIVNEHMQKRGCGSAMFSIGLGVVENNIINLKRTLDTAERAVRCGMLRGWNKLYDYGRMKFAAINGEDVLTPTLVGEMRSGTELLDSEAFAKAIHVAFASVSFNSDPALIIDICHIAVGTVYTVCRESGYTSVTRQARDSILDSIADETTLTGTVDRLLSWVNSQLAACLEERRSSRPVRDAKRYIQSHYMEPLTLELIAERVHLNASYFSIIFKKQTGQNFSDYLTWCRIEAAKQLLRESSLNISSVCEAVGYLDSKYFSRTFTKLVGIKPSAYRMLHG